MYKENGKTVFQNYWRACGSPLWKELILGSRYCLGVFWFEFWDRVLLCILVLELTAWPRLASNVVLRPSTTSAGLQAAAPQPSPGRLFKVETKMRAHPSSFSPLSMQMKKDSVLRTGCFGCDRVQLIRYKNRTSAFDVPRMCHRPNHNSQTSSVFRGNKSKLSGVWVKQRFLRYTKSTKNKRKIDKLDFLKI